MLTKLMLLIIQQIPFIPEPLHTDIVMEEILTALHHMGMQNVHL